VAIAGHLGSTAVQQALVAPNQVPVMGSTPPQFNRNIPNYQHADIIASAKQHLLFLFLFAFFMALAFQCDVYFYFINLHLFVFHLFGLYVL
jgi:hypothetical protein